MRILLAGATGLIGARLRTRLRERGHALLLAGRTLPRRLGEREAWLALDFAAPPTVARWAEQLRGVEVAINAAGIFRETRAQTFDALHRRGPIALFEACRQAGVRRIVQVSALGADAGATGRFHRSKRDADDAVLALPLQAVVAQPSLVFAVDGASSRLLLALATFPVLPLPGGGMQRVQPIHVDDATAALAALVEREDAPRGRVALVGPEPLAFAAYVQQLRAGLGLAPAPTLAIARPLVAVGARVVDALVTAPFARDAWTMLERGNVAPCEVTAALVGDRLLAPREFVPVSSAAAVRVRAQLGWLLPLLRGSLAVVWIATGVVSLWVYPVAASDALLARAGVPAPVQPLALWAAALLDLVLGVATLALRRRRLLWWAQIALIGAYTALITVRLPEFWAHPYGPLLKNLPMLAILVVLLQL
ncbi:MAG: SDR family oxidoreductase, partial [Rhizobacter sp.]|nr:SDR family oxidoreductase [Rhizobacter sp.]